MSSIAALLLLTTKLWTDILVLPLIVVDITVLAASVFTLRYSSQNNAQHGSSLA
jgi:hypothetical protein